MGVSCLGYNRGVKLPVRLFTDSEFLRMYMNVHVLQLYHVLILTKCIAHYTQSSPEYPAWQSYCFDFVSILGASSFPSEFLPSWLGMGDILFGDI